MQRPLIAGNWKMYKTATEARSFLQDFLQLYHEEYAVDVVMAPPFTALHALHNGLHTTSIALAAQNASSENEGALTGEISPLMIKDLGCTYVILGHSERRQHFGEGNALINKKVHLALSHQLRPILCVGELLTERETGQTNSVIEHQLLEGLHEMTAEQMKSVTIAYEPVWAIGTGKAATVDQATEVHAYIGTMIEKTWGVTRESIRILYGGSVNPENADSLFTSPQINGALVGKACLNPDSFAKIIASAHHSSV
ncbi:MAG: triosephosphate isomerase [Nitrospirales bacterium]|nr:MAG: triosephosphate isomerase [Nitrospirales bacterium]